MAFRQRWKASTFPSSVIDEVHVTDGKVFRVVSKKHYINIKMDSSSEVLVMKVISMRTQYQNSEKFATFLHGLSFSVTEGWLLHFWIKRRN